MSELVLKEDENLIEQNPRDKALLKIMELQKNISADNTKYLYEVYLRTFTRLAEIFFGLNHDLIKANFDKETIAGLEDLIIQKAKKRSFVTQFFMYGLPIAGWIMILQTKYFCEARDMCFNLSYRFLRARRKMKKLGILPLSLLIKDWRIKDKEQ